MRVLVTGADGFVGHALVNRLTGSGLHVIAAMRHPPTLPFPEGTEARITGDLTDPSAGWENACADVDAVAHLAGRAHVMDDPNAAATLYNDTNVKGTVRLARAAQRQGVKRFVFVSSVKAMGEETHPGIAWNETTVPHPEDPYGRSKLEAEQALLQMHGNSGFPCVILRPPLMYGTGMKGNLRSLMNAVMHGWPLPVGNIDNSRSLLDVNRFAEAIELSLLHPAAPGKVFLVADKAPLSIGELVTIMAQAAGRPIRIFSLPRLLWKFASRFPLIGPRIRRLTGSLVLDPGKIQTELGWQPAISPLPGFQAAFAALLLPGRG